MIDTGMALFLVGFPAFYALLSVEVASSAGWGALARSYRTRDAIEGSTYRDQLFRVNGSQLMGLAARVTVGTAGLFLTAKLAHRIGAPPLLIPWRDVHPVDDGRMSGHMFYRVRLGPDATIVVGELAMRGIRAYLQAQVPNQR